MLANPKLNELRQPPCEAVSWNVIGYRWLNSNFRQPPCEAVSWNEMRRGKWSVSRVSLLVRLWVEMFRTVSEQLCTFCQPPCEAVSWNNFLPSIMIFFHRQPPCEAVSWNMYECCRYNNWNTSASLWGCELKYDEQIKAHMISFVSLLVRLWVEILR